MSVRQHSSPGITFSLIWVHVQDTIRREADVLGTCQFRFLRYSDTVLAGQVAGVSFEEWNLAYIKRLHLHLTMAFLEVLVLLPPTVILMVQGAKGQRRTWSKSVPSSVTRFLRLQVIRVT